MKVIVIPVVIEALGTIFNSFRKVTGRVGNKRMSGDFVENSQNTEKNHADLRRLAVTQTPAKDPLLKLM